MFNQYKNLSDTENMASISHLDFLSLVKHKINDLLSPPLFLQTINNLNKAISNRQVNLIPPTFTFIPFKIKRLLIKTHCCEANLRPVRFPP